VKAPRQLYLASAGFAARAQPFLDHGAVDVTALYLADTAGQVWGEGNAEVLLACALAIDAQARGHAGIRIATVAEEVALRLASEMTSRGKPGEAPALPWPQPGAWAAALASSPLVDRDIGSDRPLFLHDSEAEGALVATRRIARCQWRIARALAAIWRTEPAIQVDPARLARRAPPEGSDNPPAPAGAKPTDLVAAAAGRALTIITGGPGTGKTTCVRHQVAAIVRAAQAQGLPCSVALAAPTGKAAQRLTESMADDANGPFAGEVGDETAAAVGALRALTLHALLGVRPDGSCRACAAAPLPADVVVIDEVSMVDLELMRQLVEAVRPGARLVLLGDRDQLASVDVGTVLADVIAGFDPAGGVVRLTHSHRHAEAPTIGAIARALQQRTPAVDQAVGLMCGDARAEGERWTGRVQWICPFDGGAPNREGAIAALAAPYLARFDTDGGTGSASVPGYAEVIAAVARADGALGLADPKVQREVLDAFDHWRVLTIHRGGPFGRDSVDDAMSEIVRRPIAAAWRARHSGDVSVPRSGAHWLGRPILITVNSYDHGLFNGDVGVVLPAGDGRGLAAVFRDGRSGLRAHALATLPAHEGALAMTVHKSQGSQWTGVGLVIDDRDSPIATRELVYTGITRARLHLRWFGTRAALDRALRRDVARASGLATILRAELGDV